VTTLSTLTGALAGLMVAHASVADEITLGVKDVATITDENGVGRMLFRLDGSIEASTVAIERAILDVSLSGESENRGFRLQIHPVTREWNRASVDWTTGWTRPGGDFEDDLYGRAQVHFGQGATRGTFDLTTALKEVVEAGMEADGFILTLSPVEGHGIPADALDRFADLEDATVKIRYKRIPPAPTVRGRG